jgi:hypothetical protein
MTAQAQAHVTYTEIAGIWHISDDEQLTRCGKPVEKQTYRWSKPPVPLCWRCAAVG